MSRGARQTGTGSGVAASGKAADPPGVPAASARPPEPAGLPAPTASGGAPTASMGDSRIDFYPTHEHGGFKLRAGRPFPFGATLVPGGVNFSIFSSHATSCTLVLFEKHAPAPMAEIPFPEAFRIGHVWSMIVFDLDAENIEYGYRMDGPFAPGERAPLRRLEGPARSLRQGDRRARRLGTGSGLERRLPAPGPARLRGLRLGRRPAARDPARGSGHLRDARPQLHRRTRRPGSDARERSRPSARRSRT